MGRFNRSHFLPDVLTWTRKVNMFNFGVLGLLAFLAQAVAQDLDDTTVGMPSFWENREGLEWAESAPARLAMVKAKAMKAKAAAMKAAPKPKAAMKAAPKKAAMKVSKKAELLQGESFFTQVALYGLVAAGSFSLGFFFRRKSSSASEETDEALYKNIGA